MPSPTIEAMPKGVRRHFFNREALEPEGWPDCHDNGKRYLVLPGYSMEQ